jgi:hypothetical protein
MGLAATRSDGRSHRSNSVAKYYFTSAYRGAALIRRRVYMARTIQLVITKTFFMGQPAYTSVVIIRYWFDFDVLTAAHHMVDAIRNAYHPATRRGVS